MITGYVKFLYTPERIAEKITLQATYADLANNKTTEITESFLGSTLVNLYWLITDIDLVQNLILEKGESGKPVADVVPEEAAIKTLDWSSSNTEVVKGDKQGNVVGVGAGTAVITATAKDGSGKNTSCSITVKKIPLKM